MPKVNSLHHYLVTGSILLRAGENNDISQITLNAMVRSDIKNIPMRLIGRAQQALQMMLHNRMIEDGQTPDYEIVDVVVINMLYCGFMTEEQFAATPEGQLQAKQDTPAAGPNPFEDASVATALNAPLAD